MLITDDSPDPAVRLLQLHDPSRQRESVPLRFRSAQPDRNSGLRALQQLGHQSPIHRLELDRGFRGRQPRSRRPITSPGRHQSSLQENTVLQVNNTDGSTYTYWPQNVLAFDTAASTVTYSNNVLNITGDGAQLTNQTILGVGTTSADNNNGVHPDVLRQLQLELHVHVLPPQAWVLYTNETVQQGQGVLIQMGVRAHRRPDTQQGNLVRQHHFSGPERRNRRRSSLTARQYTPAGASSSTACSTTRSWSSAEAPEARRRPIHLTPTSPSSTSTRRSSRSRPSTRSETTRRRPPTTSS